MALTPQQIQEYRTKYNITPLGAPTPATAAVKKTTPNANDVMSGVKNEVTSQAKDFINTEITAATTGQKRAVPLPMRIAGKGAEIANSIIGKGVEKAVSVLPDSIKTPVKNFGVDILETDIGRKGISAIRAGAEAYDVFKKTNPVAAADLEGLLNIAALVPASKAGTTALEVGSKVASEGGEIASRNLIKAGEKIQKTVISPKDVDIKNGFRIENVTKHNLNGPLDEVLPKTTNAIKSYRTELQTVINELGDAPAVDLSGALTKLREDFKKGKLKNLGSKASIDSTLGKIEKELDEILPNWKEGKINFSDSVDAKRAAGLNASFLHGQLQQGLSAEEKVWNNFYRILQKETEKVAAESGNTRFKELNKTLSELIPIEQAAIRRVPVAERNNVLSLTDLISLTAGTIQPGALTIGILNKALKSGKVAKGLITVGKKIKK